jgi:hypothetical protein
LARLYAFRLASFTFLLPSALLGQTVATPTVSAEQRRAHEPQPRSVVAQASVPLEQRLWALDPRVQPGAAEEDLLRIGIHGEYQVRYGSAPNFRLDTYGLDNYRPKLGQTHRLVHYLRFSPFISYRTWLTLRTQFDLPRGMLLGQATSRVQSDPEPMDEQQPMQFAPRWFYADIALSHGHLRIGQQPAQWSLGLVDDSGDNRQFFADPRFGTIVDRVAYVGQPLGKTVPWELLVASDFVYSDGRVSATDGDRSIRAALGNSYVASVDNRVGLLVLAQRTRPDFDDRALSRLAPKETTVTFDVGGQLAHPVPGIAAKVFLSGEVAYVMGRTDLAPEVIDPTGVRVSRFGAVARATLIQVAKTTGEGATSLSPTSGPLGMALEWGYASGDAQPGDGVDRRFVMNPARRVGLLMFDEVLRWKSARAAVALDDPRIGQRSNGASWALPTAGGVSSATYLNLQLLYRPMQNLDFRAAALLAQASSDFVDPAQVAIRGRYENFDGGTSTHRDLGAELDAAVEYRQPLENGLCASFGAEGATLFPGKAFADADGRGLGTQYLLRGRFGFYF